MKKRFCLFLSICLIAALFAGCRPADTPVDHTSPSIGETAPSPSAGETVSAFSSAEENQYVPLSSEIPAFSGEPYTVLNNNEPEFSSDFLTTESYAFYSDLDEFGRCGVTYACLGVDLMPTDSRDSISRVLPTGWHSVEYDSIGSLYNRCHLIGFQLTGENANEKNLITGTRYMNTTGMLPFENLVADYLKETNNHVMYRVTPIFTGPNLIADGVQMEGWSVEDEGEGVCFNVFCYNVQPGILINYATGDSSLSSEYAGQETQTYLLNTSSRKFHLPDCDAAQKIKDENRQEITCSRDQLVDQGYIPCRRCNP